MLPQAPLDPAHHPHWCQPCWNLPKLSHQETSALTAASAWHTHLAAAPHHHSRQQSWTGFSNTSQALLVRNLSNSLQEHLLVLLAAFVLASTDAPQAQTLRNQSLHLHSHQLLPPYPESCQLGCWNLKAEAVSPSLLVAAPHLHSHQQPWTFASDTHRALHQWNLMVAAADLEVLPPYLLVALLCSLLSSSLFSFRLLSVSDLESASLLWMLPQAPLDPAHHPHWCQPCWNLPKLSHQETSALTAASAWHTHLAAAPHHHSRQQSWTGFSNTSQALLVRNLSNSLQEHLLVLLAAFVLASTDAPQAQIRRNQSLHLHSHQLLPPHPGSCQLGCWNLRVQVHSPSLLVAALHLHSHQQLQTTPSNSPADLQLIFAMAWKECCHPPPRSWLSAALPWMQPPAHHNQSHHPCWCQLLWNLPRSHHLRSSAPTTASAWHTPLVAAPHHCSRPQSWTDS